MFSKINVCFLNNTCIEWHSERRQVHHWDARLHSDRELPSEGLFFARLHPRYLTGIDSIKTLSVSVLCLTLSPISLSIDS